MVVTTPYAHQFRSHVVRGAQYALRQVETAGRRLEEEQRQLALHTLSYALRAPEAWPPACALLLALAPRMEQAGYREEWVIYLEQGLAQSERLDDQAARAELGFHTGVLYIHQGRLAEARLRFEQSVAYYERIGNGALVGRSLNRLGQIARTEGRLEEAVELANAALERTGDDPAEAGFACKELGTVAYSRRQWETCVELFERSLALWEATGDPRQIAYGLSNLGTGLWGQNRLDEAAACYERAINLFQQVGDPVHENVARLNLGNISLTHEQYEEAISIFLVAEKAFRPRGDPYRLAPLYNNLGYCYEKLRQWDESYRMYQASLASWRQIGDPVSLVNTLDNLAALYVAKGDHELAITTCREAQSWIDRADETARPALEEMIRETMSRAEQAPAG